MNGVYVTVRCSLFVTAQSFRLQSLLFTLRRKTGHVAKMTLEASNSNGMFYKVVLTGGPCGGKTTGQARLSTFFESLGWKVYRAPEAAFIYLSGGVQFADHSKEQACLFQKNIIQTMLQIEKTFQDLVKSHQQKVLLICDRGIMDATAYIKKEDWEMIKASSGWNEVDLRDNNYNQIVHMVSAADGADDFYTIQGHGTRLESPEEAREMDAVTANAWVGHPCYDVIDNSTGFEEKIVRMISAVCKRIGVDIGDRLAPNSIKRKFLVTEMAADKAFPHYEEFTVIRDYLVTPSNRMRARIRKRGQKDFWSYTHTIRRPEINNQSVELRTQISKRDYEILLAQRDNRHYTLQKQRRCFLWHNQYYQLDIYQEPCPEKCKGLLLLETFTAKDPSKLCMPDFLKIDREVTHDPNYTMFKMSLKTGFLETTDDDMFSEED